MRHDATVTGKQLIMHRFRLMLSFFITKCVVASQKQVDFTLRLKCRSHILIRCIN